MPKRGQPAKRVPTPAEVRIERLNALCERAREAINEAGAISSYPEAVAIIRSLADEAQG